jgi:hypothetical protein
LQGKKIAIVFVVALFVSLMFAGSVQASADDGISSYDPIPETSPTPTFDPNATATPTPSPNATATIIYVGADHVQSINPNGIPLEFSPYNRTVVTLVYAEAKNSTVDISASNSDWNENRDSTKIYFYTEGIGTYELHYKVLYDQVVNQSISLHVQSGDGTDVNLPISCVNNGFTLDVIIRTKVLPSYPSAQDIADAQYAMQQEMLQDVTDGYKDQQTRTDIIVGAVVAAVIIIAILLFLVFRHIRHTDNEINNQNAHGFGRGRL